MFNFDKELKIQISAKKKVSKSTQNSSIGTKNRGVFSVIFFFLPSFLFLAKNRRKKQEAFLRLKDHLIRFQTIAPVGNAQER